jgi:hypothetical protein
MMNLGNRKQTAIRSAKNQLEAHKHLGNRSNLSIFQVAELLDIIAGRSEKTQSSIFFEKAFSLN